MRPDFDGLAGSFKAVLDSLVELGVIEDDSPNHIAPRYQWQKAPPKTGNITVEIMELLP